jgi:anti-sigma factor RsiW
LITCQSLGAHLFEYVEGSLPGAGATQVREHLTVCPGCEAFEDSYRRVVQLLRGLPLLAVPSDLLRRLRVVLTGFGN